MNLIKKVWDQIAPEYKKQLVIIFIINIITSFAEMISIGAVVPFLAVFFNPESALENRYFSDLFKIIIGYTGISLLTLIILVFIGSILIAGLFRILQLYMQTRISHNIGAKISIDIYNKTLHQPYSTHVNQNSSEIISGISSKASSIVYSGIGPFLTILSSGLMVLSILFAMILISPIMSIILFISFGTLYSLVILLTKRRLEVNGRKISESQTGVVKALQEGLGGIRDVIIDGSQKIYVEIYKKSESTLRNSQAQVLIVSGLPRIIIESIGIIILVLMAYFIGEGESGIENALPIIGALALGAQRMLPSLQQCYASWSYMQSGKQSIIDTLALLDHSGSQEIGLSHEKIGFEKKIELNSVNFEYIPGLKILNNINLKVNKGMKIGLVGITGSGKSTLLDLIMGLLTPSSGFISIDNINLTSTNMRSWQDMVSHVPQSIFLADASIIENIAIGVPKAEIKYDHALYVSKIALINDTIEAMPFKYETIVGERGIRLSGGQRQRIGIARALYKGAKILILDEATSALDNETEKKLMQSIENMSEEITIFIVAHRLSTLNNCDEIYRVEKGNLAKVSNISELIDKK